MRLSRYMTVGLVVVALVFIADAVGVVLTTHARYADPALAGRVRAVERANVDARWLARLTQGFQRAQESLDSSAQALKDMEDLLGRMAGARSDQGRAGGEK